METLDFLLLVAYVVTNVVALTQAIGSYRWPTLTRLIFFLIFSTAAVVNTRTVLDTPGYTRATLTTRFHYTAGLFSVPSRVLFSQWC
jgi:hypothetical protein